ncbi:MAG: hypothetical protein M3Y08_12990, partial [Fibrobacterota bacterium]|nr:hypothetical protein [Fibrobacterota bacterium]
MHETHRRKVALRVFRGFILAASLAVILRPASAFVILDTSGAGPAPDSASLKRTRDSAATTLNSRSEPVTGTAVPAMVPVPKTQKPERYETILFMSADSK